MKQVTIPAQWLQELIALCGPEDHELRERVMKSAATAPADALATGGHAQQPAIMPKGESAAAQLRAMATNYPPGHSWDKLDAKACIRGALEIEALRALLAGVSAPAALAVAKNLTLPLEIGKKYTRRDGLNAVVIEASTEYAKHGLVCLMATGNSTDWALVSPSTGKFSEDAESDQDAMADATPQAQADAREAQLLAFAVSEIRRDEMGHAPVLYVSKGQLDNHRDPDGPESFNAGRYLPARITPAGKFITPLFAVPQARDASNEWQDISTLPTCDDLIWLYCQDTNTVDGPVAPSPIYEDSWTHWAYAEAPSTASINRAAIAAAKGEGQ